MNSFSRVIGLCAMLIAGGCAQAVAPDTPAIHADEKSAATMVSPANFSVDVFSGGSFKPDEPWQQGALIRGHVAPGSRVEFLGNMVYVDEQGNFILGLGRDAPTKVEVQVTAPDGQVTRHTFDVVQRNYNIQRVSGIKEKFVTPNEASQRRVDHENELIGKARSLREARADFAHGFVWPLEGPISGVYGSQRFYNGEPRQPHYGVDIVAPVGTKVRAPAAGKVTFAYDMYYSGWTLVLDHGQGLSSCFLHLSKVLVKVGDTVKQGDVIALVGATGRVTGAHLDWRMNWLDQRIDAQLLVPPMLPEIQGDVRPGTAD
jgi:murein DD-endopeptidase MepM/ murein hydrolase activator NlpD